MNGSPIPPRTVTCPCGATISTKDLTKRYCSENCRRRFGRYGKSVPRGAVRR